MDTRADIYSLSCVLWELLVGEKPHQGKTPLETMKKHLTEPVDPPSKRRSGLPGVLDAVVMKGLSKKPEERWQSALEMCRALEVYLAEDVTAWDFALKPVSSARRLANLCFK